MSKQTDPKKSKNPNINQPEIDMHSLKIISTHSDVKTSDIIALVQNNGKVILNKKEFILKNPSYNDRILQQIITEPTLTIRPLGKPTKTGEFDYELKSIKRMVNIKISIKQINK